MYSKQQQNKTKNNPPPPKLPTLLSYANVYSDDRRSYWNMGLGPQHSKLAVMLILKKGAWITTDARFHACQIVNKCTDAAINETLCLENPEASWVLEVYNVLDHMK